MEQRPGATSPHAHPRPLAWVTGAGGLIGHHLVRTAAAFAPRFRVRGWTRGELDLTDRSAVERAFARESPELVIHAAALSRTPECEANPKLARRLNVEVTAQLAELTADRRLIFLSSDLVFDGRTGYYDENAAANPLSVYAQTKSEAEQAVLAVRRHMVIRTSLNGGVSPTGDRGFNEQLRRAWQSGQTVRLFTDEFRSPIPAQLTARAIWELALQELAGIFHVAGSARLSRFEIGRLVAARCPSLRPTIEAVSLRQFTGPPRPHDTSLNIAKAQRHLSFRLPGLPEWLAAHSEELF